MACSRCTSGCTGACAPGCTGACSVRCSSCASAGTCYGGCRGCSGGCTSCTSCSSCSGSGCTGGCSGGCTSCSSCSSAGTCSSNCKDTCKGGCNTTCNDTCKDTCSDTCTGGCKNTCDTYCNVGCSNSAMSISLATKLDASNIQSIADLILFELSRRPSASIPNNTTGIFTVGSAIDDSKITQLIQNLSAAGQTVSSSAVQGNIALKALGQEIIDKLLAANAVTVPIV